jgi:HEAT repeat protein
MTTTSTPRTTTRARLAAALGLLVGLAVMPAANAGTGGSAGQIRSAIASRSVDAIIAEVERAENLMCVECIDLITNLLEHDRYEVRQVAAWWFAKRPGLKAAMAEQMVDDLGGGSVAVRNAADYLGTVKTFESIPALGATLEDDGLSADAQLAVVRALGAMGHKAGNPHLEAAMSSSRATVRRGAVDAWQNILYQAGAAPVVDLIDDGDAVVRARAAAVVGDLREASGRAALEDALASDADPFVRRNAAWALGRVGDAGSRAVLEAALEDGSAIVRGAARGALAKL